ncbi:MAG: lysophospholipid acyltransferase family protein [Bacteroidota bacterium]|nr:lysophospholipid acyltransferase family protein [Bacteroidota bacterium]
MFEKILSYPLTLLYYILFGIALCVFHPIQWLCFNLGGYQAHKKSVDYLNCILVRNLHVLGTRFKVKNINLAPKNVPVIIVANHQSMYDIPPIIWFLRRLHPKFISKKELGKGIPSVSYNLRHGGSALIDRKDSKQAIPEIIKVAQYIEKHNRTVVIFPEGTRSKNGKARSFSETGLRVLCENAPSAYILPITINNSWKLVKWGAFPMGLGNQIIHTLHTPLKISDYKFEELFKIVEETIVKDIR